MLGTTKRSRHYIIQRWPFARSSSSLLGSTHRRKVGALPMSRYWSILIFASDDFTQLNEKFIKSRRDYEQLLEASMSHPPQPTYGRPAYTYGVPPQQQQQPQYNYPSQPSQPDNRYYSPGPSAS